MPSNHSWRSTSCRFDILRATNQHSYGRLEELLNKMNPQPVNRLPVQVLHHLGRDKFTFRDNIPPEKDSIVTAAWSARYWATCLVNSLDLETYMGARPRVFVSWIDQAENDESLRGLCPTFAELLDVLHPTKVQRRHAHEDRIINFCRAMLTTTCKAIFTGPCDEFSIYCTLCLLGN